MLLQIQPETRPLVIQSPGGGRASGARPGAAEEEVCQAAEREVFDAVIEKP